MELKNSYDFGLIIIASTRMYRRCNHIGILEALNRVFHNYIKYMDSRRLCCSIRDMMPDCIDAWEGDVPEEHLPLFTDLRDFLLKEYLRRFYDDVKGKTIWKDELLRKTDSLEAIAKPDRKGCFESPEVFLKWMEDNIKDIKPIGFEDCKSFKLNEFDLNAVNIVCIGAVLYSVGSQSYMPRATANFICENIDIMRNESLEVIFDKIENDYSSAWLGLKIKCMERLA